jgi:hypothetical protein
LLLLLAIGCGSSDDGDPPDAGISCPAGQWCIETSPVPNVLLGDVWAVSTDEVFAVGDRGTILRRENAAWIAMQSNTTANLRGVWAASGSDVWAVGDDGTIVRYDGSTWSPLAGVTGNLLAVWGSSATDVYLVGPGTVFHWDGSTFTSQTLAGEPMAISGTGPSDVWVTGESSRVSHYTGTWTTGIDPGAGATYFAMLAVATDDVWVATFTPGQETLRFDGATWAPHSAAGTIFQGFHAVSANELWAAGGSKVGQWNGSTWTTESPGGPSAQFWGVHGSGSYVWVVGSDSLILHRN